MDKIELIQKLGQDKLIAVIRADTHEQGLKTVESVIAGGMTFVEVTFTIPGAERLIEELVAIYQDYEIVVGAGTILDSETARIAILAGAQFLVSPIFDKGMVKLANRYRIPIMTGVLTPWEAVKALEYGIDVLKLFPGDAFNPTIIKSFKGPLPQALYMPTGGVNLENITEWLESGAFVLGTGSSLTVGALTGDYNAVTVEARKLVAIVREFEASKEK